MVDLVKYAGRWYELFKLPTPWEQDCVDVQAIYQVNDERSLRVTNLCIFETGEQFSRSGLATVDPNPVHLIDDSVVQAFKLNFTDGLPSSGTGSYWIHWTDYEYSLVGGPSSDYLWLLGRSPIISADDYRGFVRYAWELGYPTSRIVRNPNVTIL